MCGVFLVVAHLPCLEFQEMRGMNIPMDEARLQIVMVVVLTPSVLAAEMMRTHTMISIGFAVWEWEDLSHFLIKKKIPRIFKGSLSLCAERSAAQEAFVEL